MRPRKYGSVAEKQAAYRQRLLKKGYKQISISVPVDMIEEIEKLVKRHIEKQAGKA